MKLRFLVYALCLTVTPCHAQSASYRHQKTVLLNDLRATPGAARTDGVADICNTVTGTVRHVTPAMKKQVCASYGVPASQCNGNKYEIDHLIPLELGGSNELANLWPQPYQSTARSAGEGCPGELLSPAGVLGADGDWGGSESDCRRLVRGVEGMVTSPH